MKKTWFNVEQIVGLLPSRYNFSTFGYERKFGFLFLSGTR
jgi:hypothetical protein